MKEKFNWEVINLRNELAAEHRKNEDLMEMCKHFVEENTKLKELVAANGLKDSGFC